MREERRVRVEERTNYDRDDGKRQDINIDQVVFEAYLGQQTRHQYTYLNKDVIITPKENLEMK